MTSPEGLSDSEKERLATELEQVEHQRSEVLKEALSLGGGLGHHEQMTGLNERADAIRNQLGRPRSEPPNARAGRGWIGWVVLGVVCIGTVIAIWMIGGGAS